MEQVLKKNHLASTKANRVSKYTLSALKLSYSLSLHYFSHVFEKRINKSKTSQRKKIIKQVALKQ